MASEFAAVNLDDFRANYAPDFPTAADESAGAFNLPSAGSVADFGQLLREVGNPILDVAKGVLQFQLARDALANQAADRALDRYARQVQVESARQRVAVGGDIARLDAAAALARAQQAFRAGFQDNSLLLWLAIGGFVFYLVTRK